MRTSPKYLKIFTITICFLSMSVTLLAQDIVNIKGAKGVGVIVGRISYEDARVEALNQAKVEALRLAGVKENLQSFEMLFRSEVNNDFSEFFSSDIQAELQGAVQNYEIVSLQTITNPLTKQANVEVVIDATVILYATLPDPTFNVKVEGIKGVYEVGEKLTFSVFSTKKCYLNIFAITDDHTLLMYPNTLEGFTEIPEQKRVTFPFRPEVTVYELYKDTKHPEVNRIVFVFTKQPALYLNHSGGEDQFTTSEDIFSWIYGLTPDIRKVDYHVFTLR